MDEDVQLVRRLMNAFNRRDVQDLLGCVDTDVQFFAPQTASSVGREMMYSGHEGLRQYFADVEKVWNTLQVTPEEFHSADGHVVAIGRVAGELNGERVESEAAWAWKLRDGKAVWGRVYEKPADALMDTGFTQRPSPPVERN